MNVHAAYDTMLTPIPIAIAPMGLTLPHAGVIATRPATAAVAPPSAVGLPRGSTSISAHTTTAAEAAVLVFRNASAASGLALHARPALKPNHPIHSSRAPIKYTTSNQMVMNATQTLNFMRSVMAPSIQCRGDDGEHRLEHDEHGLPTNSPAERRRAALHTKSPLNGALVRVGVGIGIGIEGNEMDCGLCRCDPLGTAESLGQESIPIPIALPTPPGEVCSVMKGASAQGRGAPCYGPSP